MPKITLDSVSANYLSGKSAKDVFADLSVSFPSESISVILGESGCGKTTLLRLIAGGISPSKGRICFDELDVTGLSSGKRNLALVNQNITLYPHWNVFKNVAFPLMHTLADGDEVKERVYEACRLLRVEHLLTRKPKQISLGQAQRVAIAKAIVKKPDVLLFDEPFSNLDEPLRVQLRAELKLLLLKLKTTSIFVTHSVKEAMTLGDYVYIMGQGKIEEILEGKKLLEAKSEIAKELIYSELGDNDVHA